MTRSSGTFGTTITPLHLLISTLYRVGKSLLDCMKIGGTTKTPLERTYLDIFSIIRLENQAAKLLTNDSAKSCHTVLGKSNRVFERLRVKDDPFM